MKTKGMKALDGRDLVEVYYEDEDRILLVTFHFFPSEFFWSRKHGFGVLLLSCVLEDTKESVPFGSLMYKVQKEIWIAAFEFADTELNEDPPL